MIDLDDTSRCPIAKQCCWCGNRLSLLAVTFKTEIGVHCDTICAACLWLGPPDTPATLSVGEAMRRVASHCEHLGIDLGQMDVALHTEQKDL